MIWDWKLKVLVYKLDTYDIVGIGDFVMGKVYENENLIVKIFYWLLYVVCLVLTSDALPFVLGVGAGILIGLYL